MGLHEFVNVLRRFALLIVLVTVLGGAGAAAATYTAHDTYQSGTSLFVSTTNAPTNVTTEFTSGLLTAQRISTYAQLANTPAVTQQVALAIGEPNAAGSLAGEISATNPTGTLLINVTVKDRSPRRAQRIATAVGLRLEGAVRQVEAGTPDGAAPISIRVVRPAGYNANPISPDHRRDLALGLLLGLVAGVALALLLHTLTTSIRTMRDFRFAPGVPVLGLVPARRRRPGKGARAVQETAYAQLRTSLQFLDGGNGPRLLVFTGPTGGESTTDTVAGLGRALARAGASTLVIDANLGQPRVAKALGADATTGLGDVLMGSIGLAHAVTVLEPDLAVLAAGTTAAAPDALLSSTSTADLLAQARSRYDWVLIDAPGVTTNAGARALAARADAAVLVLGERRTKRGDAAEAEQLLRQVGARLVGFVVTHVRGFRLAEDTGAGPADLLLDPGLVPAARAGETGGISALREAPPTRPIRTRSPRKQTTTEAGPPAE